jgi:HTH-type transcriptional regulator/antitoxin HigA
MTLTFDQTAYSNLLAKVAPQVIETEAEYKRLLKVAEHFTFAKNLTPEEEALYKLIVSLIETYEEDNYPVQVSSPYEILQHIMEASETSEADLVGIIGSNSIVSEIVKGNRNISAAQAKLLGDYFNVLPSLFIL